MKKALLCLILIFASIITGWLIHSYWDSLNKQTKPLVQIKPRPLDKYTIENLAKSQPKAGTIIIERTLKENDLFTSSLFSLSFDPTLSGKEDKKVTGLLNQPAGQGPYPVAILLRGFIDQEIYKTGDGSRKTGEFLAQNGFITLAPDFLGYGESDKEADNIFESRFQSYTTVLSLLSSLPSLEHWDKQNIFIWAHSNGGQIALTILEITGADYPTVLWAPVSKPFPYSVLYYTDESADLGKMLRRELAKFENDYDVDLYSIHKYYDRIKAPIAIYQGTADDAVPATWSAALVKTLNNLDLEPQYHLYPGANHDLKPAWNTAIESSLNFFKNHVR